MSRHRQGVAFVANPPCRSGAWGTEAAIRPVAEAWKSSLAEGSPDLPALFLSDPRAHAPTATMAPPRPHAAAAWRRLYPSVPLRPPRALPATA